MKRICALTMVRNDDFYLKKWVEYYGSELGVETCIYISMARIRRFLNGVPERI